MKRRIWSLLCAGCLLASMLSGSTYSAESVQDSLSEETEFQTEAEAGKETPVDIEVDLNELVRKAQQIDPVKLKETLAMIEKVLSSEDFQSLFSYQEVRDLTETLLIKAGDFAISDPELTRKICIELGIDKDAAELIFRTVNLLSSSGISIKELADTEEGSALWKSTEKLLQDPELFKQTREIVEALSEYM